MIESLIVMYGVGMRLATYRDLPTYLPTSRTGPGVHFLLLVRARGIKRDVNENNDKDDGDDVLRFWTDLVMSCEMEALPIASCLVWSRRGEARVSHSYSRGRRCEVSKTAVTEWKGMEWNGGDCIFLWPVPVSVPVSRHTAFYFSRATYLSNTQVLI